jgi:hypothetical protein
LGADYGAPGKCTSDRVENATDHNFAFAAQFAGAILIDVRRGIASYESFNFKALGKIPSRHSALR